MRLPRSATARFLASTLAGLLLGACTGTLYDAAGVPPPPADSTCTPPQRVCPAPVGCVAQSTTACGDACTDCTLLAIDPNATHSCEPGAGGAYACGQVCSAGWLACSTGCCQATAVAAGDDHACAVTSDGGVACWGKNDAGQLGPGAAGLARSVRPVSVPVTGVTAVAAGGRHTCAVVSGTVQCWGANESGQLGNGTPSATAGIVSAGLTGATALALGASHSCAIVGNGAAAAVWCWGANGAGQLGLGTVDAAPHASPAALLVTASTTALSAAGDDTCAVAGGSVKCWGLDLEGQTGSGDTSVPRPPKATPVAVPLPVALPPRPSVTGPAVGVAVGRKHACASYGDAGGGTPLFCWGSGGEGEMGNRSTATPVLVPVAADRIDNGQAASVFAAGEAFTCSAKATDITMKCAGRNDKAQCGGPPSGPAVTELEVAFGGTATAASSGRAFTCALVGPAGAGVVMCWGANADGQLGRDTTPPAAPSPTPLPVGG